MAPLIIFGAIFLIVVIYIVGTYNRCVRLKNLVPESWSNVDTELKRRYDLIPNLVETVKGYAAHERAVLESVVRARAAALASTGSPESQARDENALVGTLKSLFAVAEGYPNLDGRHRAGRVLRDRRRRPAAGGVLESSRDLSQRRRVRRGEEAPTPADSAPLREILNPPLSVEMESMAASCERPIILFDGVCNLCSRAVRFILRRDRAKVFRFAAMQSVAGRELLEAHGLPKGGVEYLVLVEGGRAHTKSDAVIRIASRLTWPWRCWAFFVRLVPRFLRDLKYDFIARVRYRIFGKRATCLLAPPGAADRFLS
jgi:predicted DCC family thiol-disulfide oxidoreductase YuxK